MKKDLIEIVTEDRDYHVKGNYESLKNELKYAGDNVWVEFEEITEAFYLPQEETEVDKLLLRVRNIIAIHKLREWSEGS